MRFIKTVVFAGIACCCCAAPVAAHPHSTELNAISVLLSLDPAAVAPAPARQVTDVWFNRPVVIDHKILQGHYVIEHDNDRMARGEPCTFIYAYSDRTKPVVGFYCVHLEKELATENTVVLYSTADGWQRMSGFQFKGETASHGVPTER